MSIPYKALIDESWEKRTLKTNWLLLEDVIAAILHDGNVSDSAKVALVKEALDSFTRRGHFNAQEYHQEEVY